MFCVMADIIFMEDGDLASKVHHDIVMSNCSVLECAWSMSSCMNLRAWPGNISITFKLKTLVLCTSGKQLCIKDAVSVSKFTYNWSHTLQ